MKNPLTHEEKRRLLQLLYLGKQSHNELSEDFDESKPSAYTWPPDVPEDYDELLACGPYGLWNLADGGAFEFVAELMSHYGTSGVEPNVFIMAAIGAACREDRVAAKEFIDLALARYSLVENSGIVEPHDFGWTGKLLNICQLGLACQLIEDADRKAKVREVLVGFLEGVGLWFKEHGHTPLPDCSHELRILLELGWKEEVRHVLRYLPRIYNFIASFWVNLRLMDAFLKHDMQEHIRTMIGAARDSSARDNFRETAACAGFARGNFALAWDMFSQMENEEGDGHGALEMIAGHAAKHQMLDSWMTILDYNQKSFHRKLSPTAEFHWMMSVSYHGSIELRKEIWEYARRLQAMGEATDQTDITGFEIPYKVVIAALAGDSVAVQAFLQEENLAIAPKLRRKLMEAAVLHDMDLGVAWVLKHLEKEGNDMKMELLELEWLRLSANKPNEFRLLFEQIKALALTDPIKYKETGWSLSWFVRRRLGDPRELKDLSVFTRRPLFGWKTPGMSEGNLELMFAEALEMDKSSCEDHILYGLRKCLINRFGIREKMDMFESGRGWP